jgi:glycosyltransferase involved in cell wall biosynthesis
VRVLLHCVYYWPEVGGLESHVGGLAMGLVRRGVEVRVVASRSVPGTRRSEVIDGVDVRRIRLPSRSPPGWIAYALASIPATRRAAAWADVVHAQSFASVLPAGLAARRSKRPLVVSFHTSHFLTRAESPLWAPLLGRLVRWPDHAFAASEQIAEVAMKLAPGTRVEALTNGVDTEQFQPPHPGTGRKSRTIIVPRRLFPKNGVEFLIRAIPEVTARLPDARALVVGDGPERSRLEALARDLGIGESVRFLGSRPHDEMPELYGTSEIAVFPSLMEATSVAALEAMACELPVVASAVGGLPEIVDSEVGALAPPGDSHALAGAIVRLLQDPHLADRGRVARERVVARWSNDRLVDRHLELYRELLGGRGEPARGAVQGQPGR